METALRRVLLGDNAVAAKLSGRVWWGRRPQGNSTLPAIVLRRVYGGRDYHMTGASGLVESRVDADCYGETYEDAKETAKALRDAINGYNATVFGTQFQRISINGEIDDSATESPDRHLFRTVLDLQIWHDE